MVVGFSLYCANAQEAAHKRDWPDRISSHNNPQFPCFKTGCMCVGLDFVVLVITLCLNCHTGNNNGCAAPACYLVLSLQDAAVACVDIDVLLRVPKAACAVLFPFTGHLRLSLKSSTSKTLTPVQRKWSKTGLRWWARNLRHRSLESSRV